MSAHEPHGDTRGRDESHLPTAYERMLAHLREQWTQSTDGGPELDTALRLAQQEMMDRGELTPDEAERVGEALRRDLSDAGAWLAEASHARPLRDWLHMDLQMLESWLWDAFTLAADKTRLELEGFITTGEPSRYHSGEITGPGQLRCIACGRIIGFERAGHIPACPGCERTEFVRASRAADDGAGAD